MPSDNRNDPCPNYCYARRRGRLNFLPAFPKRTTLLAQVFRTEVDACAAVAPSIAAACGNDHVKALRVWLHRYMDFISSKRGLASALHPGDPAYIDLHDYFDQHLGHALESLLAPRSTHPRCAPTFLQTPFCTRCAVPVSRTTTAASRICDP